MSCSGFVLQFNFQKESAMAKVCLSALLVVVLLASCVSNVSAQSSKKTNNDKKGIMVGEPG